jgi:hypothetical protein
MQWIFDSWRRDIKARIEALPKPSPQPFVADKWIASSLMQKAIRRGDLEAAQRAVVTLFELDRRSLWRRLMVIAFEDVGTGSTDAVIQTVAASIAPTWRATAGGDLTVALYLCGVLADAPKDRSTDYLICAAKDHPDLEALREQCGSQPLSTLIELAANPEVTLAERATAVWYASGIDTGSEKRVGASDLAALFELYRRIGAPTALAVAAGMSAKRLGEPITLLAPLVWSAARPGDHPTVREMPLPLAASVEGLPLYALDKHTRLGKRAIEQFVRENEPVRECLTVYVPDYRWRAAACMAAYYADAAPVRRRLVWDQSETLEKLGREADMLSVGVPLEGGVPIIATVCKELDHLNAARARVLAEARYGRPSQSSAVGSGRAHSRPK